jgi:hypothetical protein
LKLPSLLPRWWCSLPLELPGESSRKRSCDDAQGVLGELRILLGGFRESKAVQLRVDLNRLHATIIPSWVEAPSLGRDDGKSTRALLPQRRIWTRLRLLAGWGNHSTMFYQGPNRESWIVIPRADSSSSNFVTAGEISPSPGTTAAHSKFSRNARETMCHLSRGGGVVAPI